jgi:hypothetical protein
MDRVALLFDRTYIDAHHCFMELANQLAKSGFGVDVYIIMNSVNHHPFFEAQNIRIFSFPFSKFQRAEYWSKILFSQDRKYKAIIATPLHGTWVAYNTAKIQKIPFYYFADELVEHLIESSPAPMRKKLAAMNYKANKKAAATIALGEERYTAQKQLNKIDYPHDYIVIPNAPAGDTVKLRSNYFRDIFKIEDRKPVLLFAGTLYWNLAKKIYEETKGYSDRDYHLIFHARSLGQMGKDSHPFIKISNVPIPGSMLNYAISSADIGLAIYDKKSVHETRNGFTGGKIGTYLKNELPLITGSADNLRFFEEKGVATYWDGETAFDEIAKKTISNIDTLRKNIPAFFRENLQYEVFFQRFLDHLMKKIK